MMDNVETEEVNVNGGKWTLINQIDKRENGEISRSQDLDGRTEATRRTEDGGIKSPYVGTGSAGASNNASAESLMEIDKRENLDKEIQVAWTKDNVTKSYAATSGDTGQSSKTQKDTNNDNRIMHIKNNDAEYTNAEPDDVSDDISIITESDTDIADKSLLQIYEFEKYKLRQVLEERANKQTDIMHMLFAFVFGIIITLILSRLFTIPKTCPNVSPNEIDIESIKAESRNILNACKDLKGVNVMLSEIKAHIIMRDETHKKEDIWEHLKSIKYPNNISNKPIVESLNANPHILDQLHASLVILTALINEVQHSNSLLKNEITETLDVVNNTHMFYESLMLLNSNMQNTDNSATTQFLQNASDKIHYTSQSLFSDLVEKMRKIFSNVHNKYSKIKRKLKEKLCHLKNISGDNEFLKQLTQNSQLLRDYNKSCLSNGKSNKFNDKAKDNTKANDVKRQTKKFDDAILHTYDKIDTWKVINEKPDSHDNGKGDNLELIEVEKCGMSEDIADNCPKFNTNVPTFDTELKHETETYTINFNSKQDTKTMLDHERMYAESLHTKGSYEAKAERPKQEFSRFDGFTGKKFNDNVDIKENAVRNKVDRGKSADNHHKSKSSSSNDYTAKQKNQQRKSADWQFQRSQAREQQRQFPNSDWYFFDDQCDFDPRRKRC